MLTHPPIQEIDEERMSTDDQTHDVADYKPMKTSTLRDILQYWQIAAKLIELTFCAACVGLIIEPFKTANLGSNYIHHFSLIFTTFIGYIVIILVSLIGRIFGDRLPYKTSSLFSLVGSGLFLITGCLILSDQTLFSRKYIFHPRQYLIDMMCTSGVFAVINSLIFALDAIFTLKMQNDL